MNNYYVYRHRRLDDNSVFYIGLGNQPKYLRARTKFGRNSHWVNVANKYGFTYEILYDNLTAKDAAELEIFFISLYGRYDLKLGNLVNKTDGGDGVINYIHTEEDKLKQSERTSLGKNPRAEKVIDSKTKQVFECIKEAAIFYKIPESTMRCYINGSMCNKTYCCYLKDYKGEVIDIVKCNNYGIVLNKETGIFHESVNEAAKCYGIKYTTLKGYLSGKFKNKTSLILV